MFTTEQLERIAQAINGDFQNTGGGTHCVFLDRPDGSIVVFSEDAICRYANEQAWADGEPLQSIF